MRKRSNPAEADSGAKSLAVVGGAAVVLLVLGIVGAATDWQFGIGGSGGGGGGGGEGRLVEMETSEGTFTIELFTDEMPVTTANFEAYVRSGFFEGTIFHRVSPTFVVQGGGFSPSGQEKKDGERAAIPLEPNTKMGNVERTLAMARGGSPDSATSEFFINMKDNSGQLDSPPRAQNDHYAVFGRVVDGWDVVKAIASAPAGPSPILSGENSYPHDPVVIERVEFVGDEVEERRGFQLYGFDDDYDVMPGGIVSFPIVVRNTGNVPMSVNLTTDTGGWEGGLERGHEDVELSDGDGDVNVYSLLAPDGASGEHSVTVTATPDEGEPQTLEFVIVVDDAIGDPRIGETENNLVQVRYLGIYDNGEIFDTNIAAVWENEALPREAGRTAHDAALKVHVGQGTAPSGYITVIPGFEEAMLGIAEGETVTARISPEKAYQDGKIRIFLIEVLSIDGTAA